ncbi:MAG: bifunctional UDP-N-acetylglucosamine diphosphorylase/glucosamine-1-phosphate N-acetyltransferase GlmU [Magnetococcales bacterium]|nr:bifunctional UDP-N-acetylglucosamine diphosphorylase/glucosamine-1-phosphate N-acetyltransferase GlmU [Magnetococcales bacterium]MBF0149304.1 bifunctional UDP-N-acetylglucosamine diphosphorylase/glucosamine-1-phosphate N-acetyltransferase GlmU [Magnetococcales bacterium]MBF0172315.1 bifunctional UDP-N-acetylglucosamine diphosphorylase/glucosamine-1-phosphate N-acetyltransferase GlmU [Magnetococcales bacterium]MBF0630668.1 bifunctional UDP-N-acetylglucosamine diphosphorylase/glucosamine-1-phos
MTQLTVLILAAGQGTRMCSDRPKVLHELAWQPLLQHVISAVKPLAPERMLIVTGHGAEQVEQAFADQAITWIRQKEQKGTGDAVRSALPTLHGASGNLLILAGDIPLIRSEILDRMVHAHDAAGRPLTLLSTTLEHPTGYGRVVRGLDGEVQAVVEERDANAEIRTIREINSGIYLVALSHLEGWINRLNPNNAQGEYYLPDIVAMALEEGGIHAMHHTDSQSLEGINDRSQLARAERVFRDRKVAALMASGVTFTDPESCWVAADVTIGRDTNIAPHNILGPGVVIGSQCQIGPFCHLVDTTIGPEVHIDAFSHLEGANIVGHSGVGPFARLRPGALLERGAKVGNFCEIKKSRIGEGSKVSHLAYIGDADIGRKVNVGAGTITCNYDGKNKFKTVIEDGVFIGSDTQLIAPVRLGRDAVIAAGTSVSKDVPEGALAITRVPQRHIPDWHQRKKK